MLFLSSVVLSNMKWLDQALHRLRVLTYPYNQRGGPTYAYIRTVSVRVCCSIWRHNGIPSVKCTIRVLITNKRRGSVILT